MTAEGSCPGCAGPLGPHPALSRAADSAVRLWVCPACGRREALLQAGYDPATVAEIEEIIRHARWGDVQG